MLLINSVCSKINEYLSNKIRYVPVIHLIIHMYIHTVMCLLAKGSTDIKASKSEKRWDKRANDVSK